MITRLARSILGLVTLRCHAMGLTDVHARHWARQAGHSGARLAQVEQVTAGA